MRLVCFFLWIKPSEFTPEKLQRNPIGKTNVFLSHHFSRVNSLLNFRGCIIFLRYHPHTLGRYPGNFTNSLCFGISFELCFFFGGSVGGPSSQGPWAKSWNLGATFAELKTLAGFLLLHSPPTSKKIMHYSEDVYPP